MPKSKPTQVITHRIELQEKERELIEQLATSKQTANYADAIKSASIPVGIVVIAGVAYFIADGIWDFAIGQFDKLDGWIAKYEEETGKSGDFFSTKNSSELFFLCGSKASLTVLQP